MPGAEDRESELTIGTLESFGDCGNVLYLDCGSGYTTYVYICQDISEKSVVFYYTTVNLTFNKANVMYLNIMLAFILQYCYEKIRFA